MKTSLAAAEPFDHDAATTEYRQRYRATLAATVSAARSKRQQLAAALRATLKR